MSDSKLNRAQERAMFQVLLLRETKAAKEVYDATGELQDPEEVAPTLNTLWVTVRSALGYVRPLVTSIEQLPKKFEFAGVTFRLIFPPEGLVQIVEPDTEITDSPATQTQHDAPALPRAGSAAPLIGRGVVILLRGFFQWDPPIGTSTAAGRGGNSAPDGFVGSAP